MAAYVEDLDEDLDEADDVRGIEDALGEDDLSERRGRGRKEPRGGGYTKPRTDQTFATRTELQATAARFAKDVRTLNDNNKAVARTFERNKRDVAQSLQMLTLLPLLIKPKSITTNAAVANIPSGTRVEIDDGDLLSSLLPMFLIGGLGNSTSYGPSPNGSNSGPSGGMDPMMMMVMLFALNPPKAAL